MKIFMLVSRVPWPLEKGDKLRAYHQLRWLATQHEVHLCCLSDRATDPEAVEQLRKVTPHIYIFQLNRFLIIWRLFRAFFSDRPFQVHYFYQKSIARKIRKLIGNVLPDHIYCQLVRSSEYVKHLHEYKKTLDYMDALSSGQRRRVGTSPWWMKVFVREETKRLTAYENLIFDYFDHHTIISTQDRQLIFHPERNKIVVIPNGIDSEYFSPASLEKKFHLVFTGNMSYPPNVEGALRLAKEILPIIKRHIPDARLLIAGADPVRSILQLESESIHVSGWMEDIRHAYNESRIFIAPMRSGSGMQNKLLEAMSMTLPSVTSPIAANAIHAIDGQNILIAETNEEFAEAAIRLLSDKQFSDQLGTNGRSFVSSNFDWPAAVSKLIDVIKS